MGEIWEFFENMNEYVLVEDLDSYEVIYMNRHLQKLCGVSSHEEYRGRKCYDVIRQAVLPCSVCRRNKIREGSFNEWYYYHPGRDKTLVVKDTLIRGGDRRYHMEIVVELEESEESSGGKHKNLDRLANEALKVALQQENPENSIRVFLEYLGKLLGGERAYVFEHRRDGNDDNTYEWVADGIRPQIQNMQSLPRDFCADWYRRFRESKQVVIRDVEAIRESDPIQYEKLKSREIHSLIAVPLKEGDAILGFYGVDNPSGQYEDYAAEFLQMLAHYIVASIHRRDLIRRLREEEQQRAEDALSQRLAQMLAERTQEYLDLVNEIIGSGLWYMEFDTSGELMRVFWSDRFREMLGFRSLAEFPDRLESWSDRLHPEDKEATMAAYWGCVAGRNAYDVKYRLMTKQGEYEWFHASGRTVCYEDGTTRLFLGTFINITGRLRAQQALEEAYQAANRANAAKTEFMANMSHDIRTPLNAIIGMTAIAAAHIGEPERVEHCLSEITFSSRHLLALVNEVLDMNRIESGKVSLNMEAFELPDLMDSFVAISKPLVESKHHAFTLNIHGIRHEKVYGDRERIQKCLMNFMGNAVKYTPEGGTIKVSVTEKETNRPRRGCYEFIFEDNGIGMSPEFMEQIFEPFARADDERVLRQQGTGLGMPITRNIIRMMNGDIKVESKLGRGSRFTATVFLELQEKQDERLEEELLNLPVLVVDDDMVSCENICNVLDELGMRGEWVTSGREAVSRVVKRHESGDDFFAVILDWKMPDMDGVAATRAIRQALGEGVPIIIISAYDWTAIEQEAREAGATAFSSKPVFKSRVAYVFRNLLGKEEKEESRRALDDYREADFGGKRVLLVEDNELNAEIALEILGMTGLTAEQADNGKTAVEMLENAPDGYYDLVFMDIQMPVMNGYEATRAIRASKREAVSRIPIVAMSANAFAEDVQASKEAGMNDHVAKPLYFDRLLSVLKEWLV